MKNYEITKIPLIFSKHENIALDIDHTLIGFSKAKEFIWEYLKNNKDKHNIHLITFRYNEYFENAFKDIKNESGLDESYFKSITGLPKKYIEEYEKIVKNNYVFNKQKNNIEIVNELKEWKGKIAFRKNCRILIDDLSEYVVNGCIKYAITYYHPNELLF